MSNATAEPTAAQPTATPTIQPQDATTEPQAPEVDWKAKSREWEQRAKANKAAADELAALKEAQKTDAEKASEALAAAKREAAEAQARLLAYDVAREKDIPEWADLLTGSTREEVEARADEVVKRLQAANAPRSPKPDPNQGRTGTSAATTADLFAAAISNL